MGGRVAYVVNASLPLKAAISYGGSQIASPETIWISERRRSKRPLLFNWGGLPDKHIPPDQIRAIAQALREAGKSFVNVEFSRADHGFNCDERPTYNAEAAEEAWVLTGAFLKKHLA